MGHSRPDQHEGDYRAAAEGQADVPVCVEEQQCNPDQRQVRDYLADEGEPQEHDVLDVVGVLELVDVGVDEEEDGLEREGSGQNGQTDNSEHVGIVLAQFQATEQQVTRVQTYDGGVDGPRLVRRRALDSGAFGDHERSRLRGTVEDYSR